uniref:GATA-type domain-containing protein n=1 Tax=Meloidogyne incognita TaxID=6306 RepID=A0A914NNV5_MELIC
MQNILIGFEKQVLSGNQFNKTKNKYYETSILDESNENIKINKKELVKENIESYKSKLSSSYWTEINLIGYKIELLEKQKCRYSNEESTIISIGNKISGNNEQNKRHCFNCNNTQSKIWHNYIREYYLCPACGLYKRRNNGKFRSKGMWYRVSQDDRKCFICGVTKTICWRRHSETGNYLCNACGCKHYEVTKKRKPKN